jgi:hypothetical protein|tara:strand:- start:425 stop:655 length:231 start_codon:yes stop_codon:yes gene_type:complete
MPDFISNDQVIQLAAEIVEDFYYIQMFEQFATMEHELEKYLATTQDSFTICISVIFQTFQHWKLTDSTPFQFTSQQ